MAIVNTKSTLVTNADNAVYTLNSNALAGAKLYTAVTTIDVAATDDDTSVYRFMRVYSDWRIFSIRILSGAMATSTAWQVGLHQTAANGGAALLNNCYGTTIDISAGFAAWLELAFEARNINTLGQQVWQDGGLTANSNRWYDLTMTGTTVGTAAGTIAMRTEFSQGSS